MLPSTRPARTYPCNGPPRPPSGRPGWSTPRRRAVLPLGLLGRGQLRERAVVDHARRAERLPAELGYERPVLHLHVVDAVEGAPEDVRERDRRERAVSGPVLLEPQV